MWWKRPKELLLFVVLCVCGFALFALCLLSGRLGSFDKTVYDALMKYDNPPMKRLMIGLTFCGSAWIITPAAVFFLVAGIRKKSFRSHGFSAALNPPVAWGANYILKEIFRRQRPSESRWLIAESGFSFPSAHAMVNAAFYGSLICLCLAYFRKPWRSICAVLLLLLAVAIGISRAFLGVHYPSDVAAGFFAGFAQAFFVAYLSERPGRFGKQWKTGPADGH